MFALKVFIEIGMVLAIVYGYLHEDELVEFETVLKWYARKQFKEFRKKVQKF